MIRKIILSLVLVLASVSARAAGYHVEVIIFENLYSSPEDEISRSALNYPDFSNTIELAGGDEAGNPFKLLSPAIHKLGGVYSQLKSSARYRPLLHLAWQQPALTGGNARAVHIIKTEPGVTVDAGAMAVKIDGTVRIRAAQFLHADVDLLYFTDARPQSAVQEVAGPGAAVQQPAYARMRESRRMKLNELHYFDHPLFGLVLHVSRAGTD